MAEAVPRLRVAGLSNAHAGPFDFSVAAGECLAVIGPSGAGKSLLLRMIADLDPHEGTAFLDGVACTDMAVTAWRRRVTYIAAESGWWHATIAPHFAVLPHDAVGALGLRPDIFTQQVALCSTGERQRLALLRGLAADPAVLLLDEPTAALDHATVLRVEDLLEKRRAAGTAIVLVTHDAAQADRIANRRIEITAGHMVRP